MITDTFGIPIHYFVRMDFDGFRKIVDALGGVDINVKNAIYDPYYPNGTGGYQTFSVKAGQQHMNGETALKYARSRQTTSDFDRARRQQEIVSAVKDKLMSPTILANPKKTTDLITIVGGHILTDFSAGEINQVVTIAKDMPNPTVYTKVLDTSTELGLLKNGTSAGGAYIIVPTAGADDYRDVSLFLQGFFAIPRIKAEGATIELKNGGVKSSVLTDLKQRFEWAGLTVTVSTESVESTKTELTDNKQITPDTLTYFKKYLDLTPSKGSAAQSSTSHLTLTVGTDWSQIDSKSTKIDVISSDLPIVSQ